MLIHRLKLDVGLDGIADEFAMKSVCVSQYRSPLDSAYKALLCSKMSETQVQACFLDVCNDILMSGKLPVVSVFLLSISGTVM